VSGLLGHIYFLLCGFKPVSLKHLTSDMQRQTETFTKWLTRPDAIILRPQEGIFGIDADKGTKSPRNNILLNLGKSLERMLTTPQAEFEKKYLKVNNPPPDTTPEVYHYLKLNKYMIRSQIDCWSPATVGPYKSFDLKTRATVAVRLDVENYKEHTGYKLTKLVGDWNSYEREFYDMLRSTLLKYNFQARLGKMNGIFIAYHNTQEMMGFEYITLSELDELVFGGPLLAARSFDASMKTFQHALDKITERFSTNVIQSSFNS